MCEMFIESKARENTGRHFYFYVHAKLNYIIILLPSEIELERAYWTTWGQFSFKLLVFEDYTDEFFFFFFVTELIEV